MGDTAEYDSARSIAQVVSAGKQIRSRVKLGPVNHAFRMEGRIRRALIAMENDRWLGLIATLRLEQVGREVARNFALK